eukprot:54593-Pyramimonas_sp.AAC.1
MSIGVIGVGFVKKGKPDGAIRPAELEAVNPIVRVITPPIHPQVGLQNPRGGDCDGCLALAGASLRPR